MEESSSTDAPEAADLVVASAHWPLVAAELGGLAVDVEVSDALKLTKATLPDARRAASLFAEELAAPVVFPGQNSIIIPVTPLDQVLAGLRVRFGRRHCGWMPTMGKNRELLDGVATPISVAHDLPVREPVPVGRPSPDPQVSERAGRGLRVGVIDTQLFLPEGVTPAERGFVDLDAEARLTLGPDESLPAWRGHCTFVTGLIHAHAPAAEIQVRAVLSGDGGTAKAWDVAKAMVSFGPGTHVINMSLGCVTADNQPPLVLQVALDALPASCVVVAAAGNYRVAEGPRKNTPPAWPAALDDVVAVGSTGPDGSRSSFSPDEPWVVTQVRGEDLVSTYLVGKVQGTDEQGGLDGSVLGDFNGYARWSGTSFAAAALSGRLLALATEHGETPREALARV